MANQKTFAVSVSTGGGKNTIVRIKADSFRIPIAEGGAYVFEAGGTGFVAAFTRQTVLAIVDETALAKAE
jgi:hypothetical protein